MPRIAQGRKATSTPQTPKAPEAVPNIGFLEGDILCILWDSPEGALSSVNVYEEMYFRRKTAKIEMQSPSTIAVTLSRMVDKGLLTVERRPPTGKGYYGPTFSRAAVTSAILDDVCRRLSGQPLGYVLALYHNAVETPTHEEASEGNGLKALVEALRELESTPATPVTSGK